MFGATLAEWAQLVGALAVLVAAFGAAIAGIITARGVRHDVREIKALGQQTVGELRTLNGSTVGQLADADETRRIAAVHPEDRTAGEDEHIATIPPEVGSIEEAVEEAHPEPL